MCIEAVLLLLTIILYWFLIATRHPRKFPPGPRMSSLPFIGDFLSIGSDRTKGLESLRCQYGDVVGLWYGPARTVIINDFDTIKEVGTSPDFEDRYQSYFQEIVRGTVKSGEGRSAGGVIFGNGPSWVEQRRFALHTLRDLGFGKRAMADLISEEAEKLCKHLGGFDGQPVNPKDVFNMAVVNSLWHIAAGLKLEYDDQKLQDTIRMIDNIATGNLPGPISVTVQSSSIILNTLRKFDMLKILTAFETITNYIDGLVKDHKETYQEENPRDFIDHYIKHSKEQEKQQTELSFVGSDGENNAKNVMLDLFLAGAETTSNTLNWAMFFMLQNPDILEKVKEELKKVTGGSRSVLWADKDNTPYTEAVLLEVQRLASVAPLTVRAASKDTTICNGKYFIPKKTRASLNLGGMMMDPQNFPNPDSFDPTRYINKDGQLEPSPKVLPFGIGRRRCLGENLAKMTLYLLFGALICNFDIKKMNESDDLSQLPFEGRALKSLKPYKIRFVQNL